MLSMLREPLPICAPVLPLNLVRSLECSMTFFCTLSLLYRIILASIQDCKDEMNSIKGLVLYHLAQSSMVAASPLCETAGKGKCSKNSVLVRHSTSRLQSQLLLGRGKGNLVYIVSFRPARAT